MSVDQGEVSRMGQGKIFGQEQVAGTGYLWRNDGRNNHVIDFFDATFASPGAEAVPVRGGSGRVIGVVGP